MDAVTLRVGDLELMSSYYENALALAPLEEQGRPGGEVHRVLGRGQVPFVRLIATPGLPGVDPRQAGLFHTAFLFEDLGALTAGLSRAGLSFADTGRSVRVEDPWGTPVTLSLPGTGTEELLAR